MKWTYKIYIFITNIKSK